MDFFTTEVWTVRGLVTYYVLFVIDLRTRRGHFAGATTNPGESFMVQIARNLTDTVDGFLASHRFLICDRDAKFTARFRQMLEDAGVQVIRTPRQAPNCKGYASHCTSSVRFGSTSRKRRRSESFRPCALTGGSSPGCSYKHSFLSL